jgi:hypothetical protein
LIVNLESFGTFGYLGLALAAATVLVWLAYWKLKRRVIARLAFILSLGALACAILHSTTRASRIEIDPAEARALVEERKEAKRRAALDLRGDEVAQIRFAEDGGEEFLDRAGLEESDLKFYDKLDEPAWIKEKKDRSGGGGDDDSLEGLIDTEEAEGGADVEVIEERQGPEPILMAEKDVVAARKLDRWNLRFSWALPAIALLLLGYDYLRRANRYAEASLPLPLPSGLTNAVTPMPAVVKRPDRPRRKLEDELAWFARRGDAFLYLTDNPPGAATALDRLGRIAAKRRGFSVMQVGRDGPENDFIFESLWYGRSSFVVDAPERAEKVIARFMEIMNQRAITRARVRQVAHIVWDLPTAPPEALAPLAQATGMSLFLCNGSTATAPAGQRPHSS